MENLIQEIWQHSKPYHQSIDGNERSYVLTQTEANELGIDSDCLHLVKSVKGEIYIEDFILD